MHSPSGSRTERYTSPFESGLQQLSRQRLGLTVVVRIVEWHPRPDWQAANRGTARGSRRDRRASAPLSRSPRPREAPRCGDTRTRRAPSRCVRPGVPGSAFLGREAAAAGTRMTIRGHHDARHRFAGDPLLLRNRVQQPQLVADAVVGPAFQLEQRFEIRGRRPHDRAVRRPGSGWGSDAARRSTAPES